MGLPGFFTDSGKLDAPPTFDSQSDLFKPRPGDVQTPTERSAGPNPDADPNTPDLFETPPNPDRHAPAIEAVDAALLTYDREKNDGLNTDEEMESIITDFLADLMHFCRFSDISFHTLAQRADEHFQAEVEEEAT